MAISKNERKQIEFPPLPSEGTAVPPSAQVLSSTDIELANENNPIFQMPPEWGEEVKQPEEMEF